MQELMLRVTAYPTISIKAEKVLWGRYINDSIAKRIILLHPGGGG
jgi:hypothetical protein